VPTALQVAHRFYNAHALANLAVGFQREAAGGDLSGVRVALGRYDTVDIGDCSGTCIGPSCTFLTLFMTVLTLFNKSLMQHPAAYLHAGSTRYSVGPCIKYLGCSSAKPLPGKWQDAQDE
jgi:hypothetical protein